MSIKLSSKLLSLFCIFIFVIHSSNTFAQNGSNAENQLATTEVYTAENPGWLVNVDEAYALSKKSGKPIMANFTGSDWCGWCHRLQANVFAKPAFIKCCCSM